MASLTLESSLICDTRIRQSFGERVCDDLSEVILQYLPFKYKFQLECVSKQFQKTIFQKVDEIDVEFIIKDNNSSALKSVLKKCPNIRSLICDKINGILRREFIDLIVKYCNNLTQIDCNDMELCEQLSKVFDSKSFTLRSYNFEKQILKSLSHIKELYIDNKCHPIYDFDGLKNLNNVSLNISSEDLTLFETFVGQNKNIKRLYLDVKFNSGVEMNILFNHISKLKHLYHLIIWSGFGLNESSLKNGVNKMAVNCKELKSFGFTFNLFLKNCREINRFLSSFKSLKRIDIELIGYKKFSFEIFKGMDYITHLTLKFKDISFDVYLEDKILATIAKYLPKLKYLQIIDKMDATDSLANILSDLAKLQTIKLNLLTDSLVKVDLSGDIISDSIKEQIRIRCKNVQKMITDFDSDDSDATELVSNSSEDLDFIQFN